MDRYTCPECGFRWTSNYAVASLAWYSDGITRIECPACHKFNKVTDFRRSNADEHTCETCLHHEERAWVPCSYCLHSTYFDDNWEPKEVS